MKSAGWFRDRENTADEPSKSRYKICALSKEFTLMGKIHGDICLQNKLLINGIPLKLKFIRSSDIFCLLTATGLSPKLYLKDAAFFVRKVKVNPSILGAHAKILNEKNAIYNIVRTETKAISIAAGQNIHVFDNVFLGKLPRRLILGVIENDSHLGSYAKSPFNFKNHTINFVQTFINSNHSLTSFGLRLIIKIIKVKHFI